MPEGKYPEVAIESERLGEAFNLDDGKAHTIDETEFVVAELEENRTGAGFQCVRVGQDVDARFGKSSQESGGRNVVYPKAEQRDCLVKDGQGRDPAGSLGHQAAVGLGCGFVMLVASIRKGEESR